MLGCAAAAAAPAFAGNQPPHPTAWQIVAPVFPRPRIAPDICTIDSFCHHAMPAPALAQGSPRACLAPRQQCAALQPAPRLQLRRRQRQTCCSAVAGLPPHAAAGAAVLADAAAAVGGLGDVQPWLLPAAGLGVAAAG